MPRFRVGEEGFADDLGLVHTMGREEVWEAVWV
jgi:hypothetical protein